MHSESYAPVKAKTTFNLGLREYNKMKIADQQEWSKSRPTHLIHVRKKSCSYYTCLTHWHLI
jgi:hypothetical protein